MQELASSKVINEFFERKPTYDAEKQKFLNQLSLKFDTVLAEINLYDSGDKELQRIDRELADLLSDYLEQTKLELCDFNPDRLSNAPRNLFVTVRELHFDSLNFSLFRQDIYKSCMVPLGVYKGAILDLDLNRLKDNCLEFCLDFNSKFENELVDRLKKSQK